MNGAAWLRRPWARNAMLVLSLAWLLGGCALLKPPEPAPGAPPDEKTSQGATYHYSLGILLALDGRIDEAIREMETAMQFDPYAPAITLELAPLYLEKGDVDRAVALSEKTLLRHPDDIDTLMLSGGLYLNLKDAKNALRRYRRVIELDPRNETAYLYVGTIYADNRRYDKALEYFQKLIEMNPEQPMANYYLAKVQMDLGQLTEAEEGFKRTLALKPSWESALLDLGGLYERQRRPDQTMKLYRDFLAAYPNRINVRLRLGQLYMREQKFDEAEETLAAALKQDRSNREVRLTLGLVYLEQGRHDQAIEQMAMLLVETPGDPKLTYLLASAYEEKRDFPKALDAYGRVPMNSDYFGNARIRMAMLLNRSGRPDAAVASLREALSLNRGLPVLYVYLSQLYEEQKDLRAAEDCLTEGLEFSPQSTELHYRRGVLYEKTDRFEASIQAMEQVLKIDPNHAEALNFIGYSYADRGIHLREAERMIRKALKISPGSGFIIDSLGWLYFRQNKFDLAIKYLREAATLLPEDGTIAEHLGDAYARTGRWKEALEAYDRALKLTTGNEALKKKVQELQKKKTP